MKALRIAVTALAIATFLATIALIAAAIWTDGPLSTRLGNTAFLTFFVSLGALFGCVMVWIEAP